MREAGAVSEPVRLGVVGAGQISQIVLPLVADQPIDLVGLTDVSRAAADALSARLGGVPVYDHTDAMLAADAVEAVYIATPPATHGALVEAALAAGKHVIAEKPWTRTAAEAEALWATVRRYPELRACCCSSRFGFTPTGRAAKLLVAEGALGRLRRVRVLSMGGSAGDLALLPAWKRSAATAGGGVAIDWAVYEVEWLREVLGTVFDPVTVDARLDYWQHEGSDLESGYHVLIRCADGLEVSLTRQPEVAPQRHDVELRGEVGGLDVAFGPGPGRLHRFVADSKTVETRECCEPTTGWSGILAGPIINLAQAIRGGGQPAAPADSQILVQRVLDAVYASAREGRAVSLSTAAYGS